MIICFVSCSYGDFKYSTLVEKYDRHGYKKRPRIVILTDKFVYGLDVETLKLRDNIALSRIDGIRLSKFADGFIVLRLKKAPNTTTTTNSNGNKQAYEKVCVNYTNCSRKKAD